MPAPTHSSTGADGTTLPVRLWLRTATVGADTSTPTAVPKPTMSAVSARTILLIWCRVAPTSRRSANSRERSPMAVPRALTMAMPQKMRMMPISR